MLKVYFIRHGETEYNKYHVHQGWGEIPLNEKGISQAENAKKKLDKIHFDRIICSDLLRTKQTCNIIFGDRDDIEYDPRLREIDNNVVAGKKRTDLVKVLGDSYNDDVFHLDFSVVGGESGQHFLQRTASVLRDLEKDTTSERIAVVTHGGVIHCMYANILQMPLYSKLIKLNNCCISEFGYDGDVWQLLSFYNKSL